MFKRKMTYRLGLLLLAATPLLMGGDCDGDETDGVLAIIEGVIGLVLGILALT